MKSFRTKKNLAVALSVLLVAAIVVLCIALRQKSDADVDPTLTLVCTPADAEGVCTVDVELTGLPDGGHYGAASIAVAFDPAQLTFLGTDDGDIPLVMGSLPAWESDPARANETGQRACAVSAGGGGCAGHIDRQRARAPALSAGRRCDGVGADGDGRGACRRGRDREPRLGSGHAHGRRRDGAPWWVSGARSGCCCACCCCCARPAAAGRKMTPAICAAR